MSRKCPRCDSVYFKENKKKKEIICAKCGLVMIDVIKDVEPEILDELDIDEIRPETKTKKNKP